MVTFWRNWAERLTQDEKEEIEKISFGFAWLNYDKNTGTYHGTFYWFPIDSGYKKDSPPMPAGIAESHKFRSIGLEYGWLSEDRVYTSLEAVAGMFPEEMEKLYQRFEAKISKEHVK